MVLLLLVDEVESGLEQKLELVREQVGPFAQYVLDLLGQAVGIEAGGLGQEGEDVILVAVSDLSIHRARVGADQALEGSRRLGKDDALRLDERGGRADEGGVVHHHLMDEEGSDSLEVVQHDVHLTASEKGRWELVVIEAQDFLQLFLTVDHWKDAAEEVRIRLSQVCVQHVLVEHVEDGCGVELAGGKVAGIRIPPLLDGLVVGVAQRIGVVVQRLQVAIGDENRLLNAQRLPCCACNSEVPVRHDG